MINSIAERKASVFAEQEWQEVPWIGISKGVEQKILDSGLKLGGLLEIADTILKDDIAADNNTVKLLNDLAEVSNNIHNLVGQNPSRETSSSKTLSNQHFKIPSMRPAETSPSFPLKMTASGIQLTACVTGYAIALEAIDRNTAFTMMQYNSAVESTHFDLQTVKEWFNNKRMLIARDICSSSISCLRESVGIPGASRAIFPLRLAFEQLETSDAQYLECRALLQRLEGKGSEFVPNLNRNESIASRIIRHQSPLYGVGRRSAVEDLDRPTKA